MKARLLTVLGLTLTVAATAGAQGSTECPPGTSSTLGVPDRQKATQDACQVTVDVFQLISPQLGTALAGGNATLGQGGTLGGIGRFSVGVRVNAIIDGDVPDFDHASYETSANGRPAPRELETKKRPIPMPTVDAALGLFKGIPLGLTNVGGIDLLVNATYVPTIGDDSADFQLKPDKNVQVGYGVRVGLLQESLLVPGIAATYMQRDLPTTSIVGRGSDLEASIRDYSVKTTAWRVVASKSLLAFGVAVGYGRDRYDQSARVQAEVQTPTGTQSSDEIRLEQELERTTMFADLSLNLPFLKLVGEIGQASGGKVTTYNTFSGGAADKSRIYGSVGLRLAF